MGFLGRDVRGTEGKAWEAVGPGLAAPSGLGEEKRNPNDVDGAGLLGQHH